MLFSKTIVSALFFALASNVFAAPLPLPDGSLDTPDVFSRDGELILVLQAPALPPAVSSIGEVEKHDGALFYSGDTQSYRPEAVRYATAHGLKIIIDLFDTQWASKYSQSTDPKVVDQFWDNMSRAMAKGASGKIYVLLPSTTTGTHWKSGTVWDRME
jgi:hypothetical protein